jgi:hypothetical protein
MLLILLLVLRWLSGRLLILLFILLIGIGSLDVGIVGIAVRTSSRCRNMLESAHAASWTEAVVSVVEANFRLRLMCVGMLPRASFTSGDTRTFLAAVPAATHTIRYGGWSARGGRWGTAVVG